MRYDGSLLYLTASRPDIQLSVGICARFQSNPKQSHLNVVKRIMRYLVGATNLSLWYKKGTFCDVTSYYDVNFAGDRVERKSTSGCCCCFLGKSLTLGQVKRKTLLPSQLRKLNMYL